MLGGWSGTPGLITVTEILGTASDPAFSERLHDLEHRGRLETLLIDGDDALRHRLRRATDKGTQVAIALDRSQSLSDGAVLMVTGERAIVVRTKTQRWLRIEPRDADAALEAGYLAGNLHWRVRFEPNAILAAMEGPLEHYLARLKPLIDADRIHTDSDG